MISEDEVRRIAGLAKLALEREELARMRQDLGAILDFVDQLESIEVDETAGAQNIAEPAPPRADEAVVSIDPDTVAANAPSFARGHFAVPRILGGES
jgi:aspartyl-tRNA(Asn)/glutamyl-tRNA(Gln) amidotransferase subunit C